MDYVCRHFNPIVLDELLNMLLHEKYNNFTIVLASQSPRRHQLLKGLGLNFEIISADVEEAYPDSLKAEEIAVFLSELKSNSISLHNYPERTLLLTADTIVWLDGQCLGKPVNYDEAIEMITRLSGNRHEVYTGVTLRTRKQTRSFYARSDVWFRQLREEEIIWYVEHCRPYDKAGSYGVQEWIGYTAIERIEGSFFNVMGLPTQKLYLELMSFPV